MRFDIETCSSDRLLLKQNFKEKHCRKFAPETSVRLVINFDKQLEI